MAAEDYTPICDSRRRNVAIKFNFLNKAKISSLLGKSQADLQIPKISGEIGSSGSIGVHVSNALRQHQLTNIP